MRRAGSIGVLLCFLMGAILFFPAPSGAAPCTWTQAGAPNPEGDDALLSIDGEGEDLWAVGFSGGRLSSPLAFRHSAEGWARVGTPNRATRNDALQGVAYGAADDVWAVGIQENRSGASRNLTLRWDGQRWNRVPVPASGRPNDLLAAADVVPMPELPVDPLGLREAWVVGASLNARGGSSQPQALRWAQGGWTEVPVAPDVEPRGFSGVEAIGANDVWAVGHQGPPDAPRPLAMHWDGAAWIETPIPIEIPRGDGLGSALLGISAFASDDVWASGYVGAQALLLHWDGTGWTRAPIDISGGPEQSLLAGIDVGSDGAAWTTGVVAEGNGAAEGFIGYMDPSGWKEDHRRTSSLVTFLMDVVAAEGGVPWAVGFGLNQKVRFRSVVLGCT